jgi:hypothetical protein
MLVLGAWLAPVAHAQLIGDVIDDVVGGGDSGSTDSGSTDSGSGDSGGGLIDGVIGGILEDDDSSEPSGSGPIREIVNAVDKSAGDTTEAVDDATGGTVGNIGQTTGTLPAAGGTVKKVTKGLTGTSGPGKKKTSARAAKTTGYPVAGTWEILGESFANANGMRDARDGAGRPGTAALVSSEASSDDSVFSQIGRVAAEAVQQAAFPLILTMLVGAFLMVQNRIDRKDPKLALAPVDSEHDLLSFT